MDSIFPIYLGGGIFEETLQRYEEYYWRAAVYVRCLADEDIFRLRIDNPTTFQRVKARLDEARRSSL